MHLPLSTLGCHAHLIRQRDLPVAFLQPDHKASFTYIVELIPDKK